MIKLDDRLNQVFGDENVVQVIISKEDYIEWHKEIERLHSIIEEVREWILFQQEHSMEPYIATDMLDDILEILDKENE